MPRVVGEGMLLDVLKEYLCLDLSNTGDEKDRGVYCNNKAEEHKLWWTTYLY